MDVEKLIERLYQHDKDYGEGRTQDFFRVCLDCKDAATALSTLQIENEKLRVELDRVKQERDEAVECINDDAIYEEKKCESIEEIDEFVVSLED